MLSMMFLCVNLFVFLEVLGPLEGFLAYLAHMGLQRSVYWRKGGINARQSKGMVLWDMEADDNGPLRWEVM